MSQIHYVIGIGRSGTSLLMSLLGAHPEIHTPPENYFRTFFLNAFKNKTHFSVKEIQLLIDFNACFHILQPVVGYDYAFPKEIQQNGFTGNFDALCQKIYLSYKHHSFPYKNPTLIVDKNPSNTLFLNQIKSNSPKAKFILMVRDYRANILSRKQSIHLLSPNVVFNAVRWRFFTRKALQFKSKFPEQVLVVRYEDLVISKENELRKILNFLNVKDHLEEASASQERTAYQDYKSSETVRTSIRAQKKYEDLSKPIFQDRIEQWKKDLSPKEILIADSICQGTAETLDYTPHTPFKRLDFKTHVLILYYRFLVFRSYIKDLLTFYAPISMKVRRFKQYVQNIDQKRKILK